MTEKPPTGEQIIEWRQVLGWSRQKAAMRLKTPFYTLRQWERGNAKPPGVLRLAMDALTEKYGKGKVQSAR